MSAAHGGLALALPPARVLPLLAVSLSLAMPARAETPMRLQAGEVRVLAVPDVARVAVGDGQVLNAVAVDGREVVVFARQEGDSAVHVWTTAGRQRSVRVQVAAAGSDTRLRELRAALARIPDVQIKEVGDRLLVEGDALSETDRARVAALAERYPQLLDFTGTVGWDRMVLLDVQVIELPRSVMQSLGLRWSPAEQGGLHAGLAWDGGSTDRLADRPGDMVLPLPFPAAQAAGYLGVNALLSARIQALARRGVAVVLAQPQLLARSGATAEFLAGGEVPYSTQDANGRTQTVFKPYGVSLKITPHVERDQAIRSRIEVEVSAVDGTVSGANGPALKTRRAITEFNARSGQTLVLAGFLSRERSRQREGLPGLSGLPLLGALFRSTQDQHQDTELAVFVTPVVMRPDDAGQQRQVDRGRSLLASAFPEPLRLLEGPPAAAADAGAGAWARRSGQWSGETVPLADGPDRGPSAPSAVPVGVVGRNVRELTP